MTCWYCDQPATQPSGLCGICERTAPDSLRWAHDRGLKHYHVDTCMGCGARTMHQSVVKCSPSATRLCARCAAAAGPVAEPKPYDFDPTNRGYKKEKRIAAITRHRSGRWNIRGKGKD